MRKPEAVAAKEEDIREILGTDDINGVGKAAHEETRLLTGDRVYYGSLSSPEEVSYESYDEVLLSDRDDVEGDSVDVFVGEYDDTLDAYREAEKPVDVAVVYGDGEFAERLVEVDELSREVEIRAVTLVPDGRTTAYTDLKAVAAARLSLDVVGVRVRREKVGDKLAQTSLAYGANDLGFVDEDDGFDAELAAREAGFTPVDRIKTGGYSV
jgi:hypothetical protein